MRDIEKVVQDNERFSRRLAAAKDEEESMDLLRERCQAFIDMIIDATNPIVEGDEIFLVYALERYAEGIRKQDPEIAENANNLRRLFGGKVMIGSMTILEEDEK